MIVDVHTHIGFDKDGVTQNSQELLKSMDAYKIDYSVSFPLDEKTTDLVDASLSILNLKNPRIIPFLRFDPKAVSADKVAKLLTKFKGVKLHTRSQNFDVMDKKIWPIFEVISKSKKPLLIHTRKGQNPITDPDHVSEIAEHFTDMKIIIGHFAESAPITTERVKKFDNLYLETSIMSLTPRMIGRVFDIVGAEKILFGSDSPYSDQELELLKVKKSKIPQDEQEMVLYKNALKLLGMNGTKPIF